MAEHYYLDTMGCQMNERDSETIAGVLHSLGLTATTDVRQARVAILNTCAVREKPEHKVFSRLGELARLKQRHPRLIIGVCGCVAQLLADQIRQRSPYVNFILGPRNLSQLRAAVAAALAAGDGVTDCTETAELPDESLQPLRQGGVTAFINVMYGCDNFCAYCVVPYTRGREVSRPVAEVLAEVRQVVAEGFREVMLLGQNVNSYRGLDEVGNQVNFADLLRRAGEVEGLWRVRFTTSHPKDLSPALLQAMAQTPTACEHLHLPLQAGADEVLAAMGRGYTLTQYRQIVDQARNLIPDLTLTTDVMVGFPGETEAQFEQTLQAFEEIRFDQAFMFKYSDRPGTAAEQMPDKVPEATRQRRLQKLVDLQNRMAREINVAQQGQVFEVLVEGRDEKSPDKLRGRTRGNKLMIFTAADDLTGQLVRVKAEQGYLWGYLGELQGEMDG